MFIIMLADVNILFMRYVYMHALSMVKNYTGKNSNFKIHQILQNREGRARAVSFLFLQFFGGMGRWDEGVIL